ncbi:AfsR/SARP family transcriptional regulator [Thalassococcus sp. BH17M4-6]|uniref:AfsR/SARP family transcriptional regulator n=1 Tax=Thalassococcus sp. BH17M4-6 TaxID=3413148 RepID=UPI003BD86814
MEIDQKYTLKVLGAFDLLDGLDKSIRPSGRKECAILAMLALTANHRQTRAWLQEKLWGDRGPAQGSASLRHALSKIRGVLNTEGDVIRSDRTWVWLDASRLQFDHLRHDATGEILRGFDLRDEGFNEWLRDVRSQHANRVVLAPTADLPQPQTERRWYFNPPVTGKDERLIQFGQVVVDGMMESAMVLGLGTAIDLRAGVATPKPQATDMISRLHLTRFGSDGLASATVTDGFGTLKWQFRREVSFRSWDSLKAVQLEIAQNFQDFVLRSEAERRTIADWSAHVNGCHALMGLMVPGSMPLEDIILSSGRAIAAEEKGLYHALLAQAQLRKYGEREETSTLDLDEIMGRNRSALALSPENGLVHALAGHSFGFFMRDFDRNAEMTREACRLLPGNGLCRIFRAISLVYTGQFLEAVKNADLAVMLCRGTVAYAQARSAQLFARLMAGDARGAICSGEYAVDSLTYRPTVTDLMVAYAMEGRIRDGRAKLRILCHREPDLCLDMLRSPSYPIINTTHRTHVIDAASQLGLH